MDLNEFVPVAKVETTSTSPAIPDDDYENWEGGWYPVAPKATEVKNAYDSIKPDQVDDLEVAGHDLGDGRRMIILMNEQGLVEYKIRHPDGHLGAVED